jgi:hypothetical protein
MTRFVPVQTLSWVYQSGNNRLGTVDLFACEISAICRVSAVTYFAEESVGWARQHEESVRHVNGDICKEPVGEAKLHGKADLSGKFTSEEQYTPVYNNMLSELQSLDVNVVTSVTEFYTYQKALVDYLRLIAVEENPELRYKLLGMIVYMEFLMYESGREAVNSLIEFEPNKEESIINILYSELVTYAYLVDKYSQNRMAHV